MLESLQSMYEKTGNKRWLEKIATVKSIRELFLFEGYKEHLAKMLPIPGEGSECSHPIVLCHNDAQENNILMGLSDNQELMLIDYEYAGWNPMAFDLANYVNETMLDNAYPEKDGIAWYVDNCMSHSEIRDMSARYLQVYFDNYAAGELKQ